MQAYARQGKITFFFTSMYIFRGDKEKSHNSHAVDLYMCSEKKPEITQTRTLRREISYFF